MVEANDAMLTLGARVRRSVAALAPDGRVGALDLGDEVTIGDGGLGFDSIRLVELLLRCEEELGVILPAELLPAGDALTIGHLVDWVRSRLP